MEEGKKVGATEGENVLFSHFVTFQLSVTRLNRCVSAGWRIHDKKLFGLRTQFVFLPIFPSFLCASCWHLILVLTATLLSTLIFLEPIFPPWEDLMTLGAQPSGYIIPMSIFFNAFCSASHRAGPGILMHMNYAFLWGLFLFSMEQRVKLASVLFIFWLFLYYNICLFKKHTNTKIDMFGYCTVCVPFPIPFPWFGLLVTIPSLP